MNILLFLLVACFWGGSFVAIQPLVQIVPPIHAAFLRIFVAVVFLIILFPILKVPMRLEKSLWRKVYTTGLFAFTIPFALLFWGETRISAGLAGILNGTVPIFVFVLGLLFTPGIEKTTPKKILGLVLGIVGVIAIFYPKVTGDDTSSLWGAVAVTLMAAAYAASALLNRVLFTEYPKLHPFTNLIHQLGFGLITLFAIAVAIEGWQNPLDWKPYSLVWGASIYLGVGSTSIAFVLFYRLIKEWGAVRASTVTYVIPAAALLFDLILNGTTAQPNELLGVLCVTIGVVILNFPAKMQSKGKL